MANYSTLKSALDEVIKTNIHRMITGDVLNSQLDGMIDALGAGYQYMGMATTSTNPGTPDARVVWLASTPGTYTYFGNQVLTEGKIAFFRWDGSWHKDEVEVQPVLTMDDTPTEGSDNPVKSGGIYNALQQKQPTIDEVNVTVDNNHGTPSGTASMSGGTLSLAFSNLKGDPGAAGAPGATGATGPQGPKGPKGDQGNPGSSVDYPFTLANNLETEDSTKALAAPQGGVLKDTIGSIRLGQGQDGLIYIFVDGEPQGYGFDPQTGQIIIPEVYGDVVVEESGVTINKNGTGTLHVKLSQRPSVTQYVSVNSTSEHLTASTGQLTFNEANWNTWQAVTLTNAYQGYNTEAASIVLGNSDPALTDTTVPVTLKGIMYEDLVDTTIPSGGHVLTADDFEETSIYGDYIRLYRYNGAYTNIIVPATINDKTVWICAATSGTSVSFKGNTTIQYVTFADGVIVRSASTTSGGNKEAGIFQGCTSLIGVSNLPICQDTMNNAFADCSALKFVDNLDSHNPTDTYQMFIRCTSLEYVQDLTSWTNAGLDRSFRECSSLQGIMGIPQPSAAAGFGYAFMQTQITEATIPANANTLIYCFSGNSHVTKVTILADDLTTSLLSNIFGSSQSQNIEVYANPESTTLASLQSMFSSSTKVTVKTIGGSELPSIVVWGDSTSSPNKPWTEWPARLQTKLGTSDFLVKNQAVSGEWTTSTAARQGGDAMHTNAIEIPATVTAAQVTLTTADNQVFSTSPIFSAGGAFNPCKIAGVQGNISRDGANYYFTRLAAGSAVSVPANTPVVSDNDTVFNAADNIMLINIGHNKGWNSTAATLVNQMKLMVDHFRALGGTKYIVTGPWSGTWITTDAGWAITEQVATLAAAEFGSHWLNLPGDMAVNAETDNPEWEPTESDLEYMAEGKTPMSLTYDNTHPTTYGANSQMMAFYRKGVALGYWE